MHLRRLVSVILLTPVVACSSASQQSPADSPQAGAASSDSPPTSSGAGGANGDGSSTSANGCSLPAAGSAGVARPSGAAENLRVLDWAGFEAAVSYTFDDANSSQIAHYAEIQALGVPMTFYLQTGKSEAANDIWAQAVLDGHELGNHTESHARSATGEDIDAATEFIEAHFGVTPYTMAAPYGDTSYVSLAETRFLINRGVGGGRIAPYGNSNPFNLPCYIPPTGAEASAMNGVIDTAHSAGSWQIVLVHGFTGGTDGAYQPIDIEAFVSNVEHAKSLGGVWIDSVAHVGAYWIAQKLFADLTPATSGTETTWSWTLPDHFPPGACLRVATDGGTLVQNGEALTWDDHGYYQVSLDAGSLTLTP